MELNYETYVEAGRELLVNVRVDQPHVLLLFPLAVLLMYFYLRPVRLRARNFIVLRSIILVLILAALASPYITESKEVKQDVAPITILVDNSTSMLLYHGELEKRISDDLSGEENLEGIEIEYFSSGNETAIGDAVYRGALRSRQESMMLLISDGQSNRGKNLNDVGRVMGESNQTLFSLVPAIGAEDIAITGVAGEKKIPVKSKYSLGVMVEKNSMQTANYYLKIIVDGREWSRKLIEQTESKSLFYLNMSFHEKGIHEITVEISPETEDYFDVNNVFYKTVEVVEKPKVLLMTESEESPLFKTLSEFYTVEVRQTPTAALKDYSAVVLDNINAQKLNKEFVGYLRAYVLDGGGLVVVGGRSAYDWGNYSNSYIEGILPVNSAKVPEKKRKPMAFIFVIDISGSTENEIKYQKAIAVKLLQGMQMNDSVGVIAFNAESFVISELKRLGTRGKELEDTVASLKFGGGSLVVGSLRIAESQFENVGVPPNKYIILISDGDMNSRQFNLAQTWIEKMAKKGVTTHAVGVGLWNEKGEGQMRTFAQVGNGLYFGLEDYERLLLEFEEDENQEGYGLWVSDRYHFITHDLDISGISVKAVNDIGAKSAAHVLVTAGSDPLLTVWRFGLGGVAALATDNGQVWGEEVYRNTRFVSAISNWAIGDMEAKKNVRVSAEDAVLGGEIAILVRSLSEPEVTVSHADMVGKILAEEKDKNTYAAKFTARDYGFYVIGAKAGEEDIEGLAVNYPYEYREILPDTSAIGEVAVATGGMLYNESDIDSLEEHIRAYIERGSTKNVNRRTDIGIYFMIAALTLFFADAAFRRVGEILRLRQER